MPGVSGQNGSPTRRSNLLQRIGIVPSNAPPARPSTRPSASDDLRKEALATSGRANGGGGGGGEGVTKKGDERNSGKVDTWEGFYEPATGGNPRKWYSQY
ncbi:hypothetical protein JDV02_005474 [Purpureocillium takamizusanense]|uniref:Uncharacterized protein n=1 Tax=Purpureocillium takamizusanense TaxID=2060973 RepID=A0A9Q8VAD6_9HYPO|nr:uncharacterized protein JDV02_005474 [Purpureocillium takamizusanense]UNI19280.1 hypothetical protein JDV02_005474 [Purpureocillium takamizusanense]